MSAADWVKLRTTSQARADLPPQQILKHLAVESTHRLRGPQGSDDLLLHSLIESRIVLAESVENIHHLAVGRSRPPGVLAGFSHTRHVACDKRTSIGGGQIGYEVHAKAMAIRGPPLSF